MNISDKKRLVKANAKALDVKVSDINLMTEEQLDALVAKIDTTSEPTVPDAVVSMALETNDTFITEKGEVIAVINAQFEGATTSAFRFKFADKFIITTDNDVRFLYAKGGLKPGDVVAFKPETVVFNGNMNAFTGTVNKSATPAIMKVVAFRTENRIINDAQIAELTAQGITPQKARELVEAEIVANVRVSRPTFKLD